MPTEYIEINSMYRNRTEYPRASDFVVQIAQSGSKCANNATDPVCISAVYESFIPFSVATFTVAPSSGNFTASSSGDTFVVNAPAGSLNSAFDYYSGAVITLVATPFVLSSTVRDIRWSYINTSGGQDYFQLVATGGLAIGNYAILDPTDLSDPANPLLFIPSGASSDNFYINQIIYNQTRNEWLTISAYDGTSHVALLQTTNSTGHYTPGTWLITDTYSLRSAAPSQFGSTVAGPTATSVTITPLGSNVPATVYVGSFLRVLTTPPQNVRITAFNTTTNTATVSPAFNPIPAIGTPYEFLPFSYDNEGFLNFNNTSAAIREAVCYDISLMNIVLPSETLIVSRGSRIVFYPYIYVEFRSTKNSDGQGPNTLISNNPNARRMMFRALAGDNEDVLLNPFIRLDGDGTVQRIKLDPLSSYYFAVKLPDGSFFKTDTVETFSPLPPNPLAQISAMFSVTRASS